jgi:two-component system, OmpR family, phosphate regulon sensor histidine kinase PhoR
MNKNQTPLQISFIAAFTSASMITLLIALLEKTSLLNISTLGLCIIFCLIIIIDFVANYFYVRFYIFRKIKLIYKIIHRHKTPSDFKADKIEMKTDILDNVEKEVGEWAEEHQREMENLEQLTNYRRQFMGNVSHELKTPIFNVQGFINTLIDGAIHDPKVNMQFLERASKNIDRLEKIVEDLETISKLETGQLLLDLREFDLHELSDEVFSDLEIRATKKNVKLIYKENTHQHFKVRADKEAIRQVFMNLCHNSIKYGKEGGLTKVSFYDMDSFILVEVSDNGIGINEEDLKHVFDRFYRVDKSRSRDAGGTGLGLSIVKHIIEAHKQTINVRSNEGQGSTFGFTLEKA